MGATAFYLLILQNYVSSKQKILKCLYPLCLGNISGNFSASNMKKTGLNGCLYDFSFVYKTFDTSSIIDIHKYLMKRHNIK